MKKFAIGTAMMLAALAPVGAAQACGEEPLAAYSAQIGARDHVNSNGARLTTVAQILQQDRANVNSRGIADAGDTPDAYFTTASARAQFALWLENGYIDEAASAVILAGGGPVTVYVYDGWIEVAAG